MKAQNKNRLEKLEPEVAVHLHSSEKGKHIKFVEDKAEQRELISILKPNPTEKECEPPTKEPMSICEFKARKDRHEKLELAQRQLELQRNLMGKGMRRRIGEDEFGMGKYKWAAQRKK